MTNLPSGTVTFLFTDIEGSTRLLEEQGERYAELLEQHRRVLRESFKRYSGVEVDTQGDAFFVAFARASDAVAAAEAAQRELELPVRMGIHTGEPQVTTGGYVGIDVHRAARICAAAHGRQLVISERTARLLEGMPLHDLGPHRLKDVGELRLYQLGERDFPPIRSLNQTNLPAPPNPLLGRKKELADLLRLVRVERARLVTITGPGGTGKTRFALELAAELVEDFRDGVWFVDLSAVRDAHLVMPTIGGVLGAKLELPEHVADKELLLLLDNFEQVIDAARALASLLERCPNLQLIVTSREPLHVGGERRYPLRPLAESPAVELFRQRAEAADASFDAPYDQLAEVCRLLDKLPLALELAAARTATLTVPQLLERLGQRLPLLASRARDVPERQRTLRAAIEWSYDLLPRDEQELFTRLSVFAGGFTLDAAEEVADADIDLLESLVEKSLLRRDAERFTMLETIREFAAARLADDTRRKHAEYFADFASDVRATLRRVDEQAWLDRLWDDVDNLRVVLAWLSDAAPVRALSFVLDVEAFWNIRVNARECLSWLERALERSRDAEPALRAKGLEEAAAARRVMGDHDRASAYLEEALVLADDSGDQALVAQVLLGLGRYEEALERFRGLGDERGEASVLHRLADAARDDGDFDRARELYERALELGRRGGRSWMVAAIVHSLGDCALDEGRLEEARRHYATALEAAEQLGSDMVIANAIGGVASVAAALGDRDVAGSLWSAALRLEREAGHPLFGDSERKRYGVWLGESEPNDVDVEDAVQLARAYLH